MWRICWEVSFRSKVWHPLLLYLEEIWGAALVPKSLMMSALVPHTILVLLFLFFTTVQFCCCCFYLRWLSYVINDPIWNLIRNSFTEFWNVYCCIVLLSLDELVSVSRSADVCFFGCFIFIIALSETLDDREGSLLFNNWKCSERKRILSGNLSIKLSFWLYKETHEHLVICRHSQYPRESFVYIVWVILGIFDNWRFTTN